MASAIVERKRIVFFHPDLGIGGAERLIIDAAVGLQDLGHKVTIFTSHCDPKHCFEEARDGTLDVRVRGNFLPSNILNRFHILLAILRQIHLVLSIAVFGGELWMLKPDVFVVDQLSACVPLLRWCYPNRQRTLFYCHFPDQLLAQKNGSGILSVIKKVYRMPFDWFEGWSMSASDRIVVNSNFTRSVSKHMFPQIQDDLRVIYPCVDMEEEESSEREILWNGDFKIVLSINRFERKKDIGLAIRAYKALTPAERRSTRLILAGGYDSRVTENVQYHKELVELAESYGLQQATARTIPTALAIPKEIEVLFLLSIPGSFKTTLLQNAKLLLYTPSNEHFGIVPVEAMQFGLPVLASNTGGPLETVVEGETGWLRDVRNVDEWTLVVRRVLIEMSPAQLQEIAARGRQRVRERFTRPIMATTFQTNISEMLQQGRNDFVNRDQVIMGLGMTGVFIAALITVLVNHYFPAPQVDRRMTAFAHVKKEHDDGDSFPLKHLGVN